MYNVITKSMLALNVPISVFLFHKNHSNLNVIQFSLLSRFGHSATDYSALLKNKLFYATFCSVGHSIPR